MVQELTRYDLQQVHIASLMLTLREDEEGYTCVQDDILHDDLTVRENLAYSAWLRSNIYMISEAKGEVVDDVLDLLRLRHVQVIVSCKKASSEDQALQSS